MKFAFLFLLLILFAPPLEAQASAVLFEHRDLTYLSRDVSYERVRQVTSAGFRDVHILRIPLNDPYISIAPVESAYELGLRESTQTLLSNAGAIAGTNADFFGMAGRHSLAFGPVINDGQLMSISAEYNRVQQEFAAFFLDDNGFPMLRYITPTIWFTVAGMQLMDIASVNKVVNLERPHIITTAGMTNTSQLNMRFPNIRKVIASGGYIIATTDQPINIPEDGFVVVMNEQTFNNFRPDLWVGMSTHFDVFTNLGVDLSAIQTAVGGGGLILRGGQIVHDTGTAIAGRHPRTALGISSCWQRLILMAVDGRGHSIGATHEEMAALLLQHGAVEAMHLDGGGSTTMVAQNQGRHAPLNVVNRVSDGSQRLVVNALGVFDSSTPGELNELVLIPYERYIARGTPLMLNVYGLDLYRHRVGVNLNDVTYSAYSVDASGQRFPAHGTWDGNMFIPEMPGALYIVANYGTHSVSKMYLVLDIVALQFSSQYIFTSMEWSIPFAISGLTSVGSTAALNMANVVLSVNPPDLGLLMYNVFIPTQEGVGYITAHFGSVVAHLPVAVTGPVLGVDYETFISHVPARPAFMDPIRAEMTAVVPGNAHDFELAMPGSGALAYSSRLEGSAMVFQMSAINGGIFATDPNQWARFLPEINAFNPEFVIIRMDVNPLRRLSWDERELFHHALRQQQAMGRTVFVISNAEQHQAFSMRDGIRYIDLGNTGYDSVIQFRIIDRQIWYDF